MKEVDINIYRMPIRFGSCRKRTFGYFVSGKDVGYGAPAKERDEIVKGIRDCIEQEKEYHNDNIMIRDFCNSSGLDITIEDIENGSGLKSNSVVIVTEEMLTPEQWEEIEKERLADEEAEYEMMRKIADEANADDKNSLTFKQVDEGVHRVFNKRTHSFYDLELEIDVVY